MQEKRIAFVVPVTFAENQQDGSRQFKGVAYSGGIITDHPFFERIAFDLESTTVETPAPLLLNHESGDPIGLIEKASVGKNIEIAGRLFSDVEGNGAIKVAKMADRGMPWQMSVGIFPGEVSEVKAGKSVTLNGQKFDGPLTVLRQNRVREVSFCALGADGNTSAEVFAIGGNGPRQTALNLSGASEMDQAEHDRIVADLTAQLAARDAELTTVKADLGALREKVEAEAKARRVTAVKSLFAATGREFTDDAAKPYLAMSDEAFDVLVRDLKVRPADPSLFRQQATEGDAAGAGAFKASGNVLNDAESIRRKARAVIEAEAKAGVDISLADAVQRVMLESRAAA